MWFLHKSSNNHRAEIFNQITNLRTILGSSLAPYCKITIIKATSGRFPAALLSNSLWCRHKGLTMYIEPARSIFRVRKKQAPCSWMATARLNSRLSKTRYSLWRKLPKNTVQMYCLTQFGTIRQRITDAVLCCKNNKSSSSAQVRY